MAAHAPSLQAGLLHQELLLWNLQEEEEEVCHLEVQVALEGQEHDLLVEEVEVVLHAMGVAVEVGLHW